MEQTTAHVVSQVDEVNFDAGMISTDGSDLSPKLALSPAKHMLNIGANA